MQDPILRDGVKIHSNKA